MIFAEIAAFFGSDATKASIKFQFATRIKEDAALLREARKDGVDCKDVTLKSLVPVTKGRYGQRLLILFRLAPAQYPFINLRCTY